MNDDRDFERQRQDLVDDINAELAKFKWHLSELKQYESTVLALAALQKDAAVLWERISASLQHH